jgi:hypothetical protein
MTLPLADNLVAPLLVELRDCVCAQLATTPVGPVCRCMIVHNFTLPPMDGCDCTCAPAGRGDGWVRLVRLEPEISLNLASPTVCPTGWQAIIELGVYRCVPLTEDGAALPEREVTDLALDMLADMNALIRVLGCCNALKDRDVGVEFWQPVGPAGGCAGGTLQIRVALSGGPGGC